MGVVVLEGLRREAAGSLCPPWRGLRGHPVHLGQKEAPFRSIQGPGGAG